MSEQKNKKGNSRRGLLKGTAAAVGTLALTGMDINRAEAASHKDVPGKWDLKTDVLIVGAGGAGLISAITAREEGAKVIVLEEAPVVGGTTTVSGGMIQAAGTDAQKAAGVKGDSNRKQYKFFTKVGEDIIDPQLVKVMTDTTDDNMKWLKSHGLIYSSVITDTTIPGVDPKLFSPRIHSIQDEKDNKKIGTGRTHVKILYRLARKLGVKFMFDTPVKTLIYDNTEGVTGVMVHGEKGKIYVKAKRAVILASGGFDHNKEMARTFSPQQLWTLKTGVCYGAPTNTGDGIRMAMAVGADLAGMGGVIGLVNHAIGIAPIMRGQAIVPGIWVNKYGQRFVNEAAHYAYAMRSVFSQEDHMAWAIFDEDARKMGGKALGGDLTNFSDDLKKEVAEGKVKKGSTIGELAVSMGVDASILELTLNKWNKDTARGKDTVFNKKTGLKPIVSPPFYATLVNPISLGSCGGVKINTDTQVIDVNGKKIPRLYAGGMTTGGWIGPYYPGSGTALAANICFGRIAGKNAASEKPSMAS